MTNFVDRKFPDPEVQHAEEIKQAETELAPSPQAPAAQASPEPEAPEAPPAADAAPDASEEAPKLVPLKALHESREKEKAEREKNATLERRLAEYEGYMRARQEQQPPEPIPDPETDAVGYMKWQGKRIEQLEAQRAEEARERQLKGAYAQAAQTHAATDPEFGEAYRFLWKSRSDELKAVGMPPAQIAAALEGEELDLAWQAFQNGQNPALVLKSIAVSRGFKASTPETAKPSPAQLAEQAEARAAAALSLSKGGKPPKSGVTWEDLANLKGAAFDAAWDKLAAESKKSPIFFR